MVTTQDIEQLKALTDGAVGMTDIELGDIIAAEGSVKHAAVRIWRSKAASYASLVNVSESGSTRNLGDLHKQALTMADTLAKDLVVAEETVGPVKMTRRIVRR